jgi:hypothetical protein
MERTYESNLKGIGPFLSKIVWYVVTRVHSFSDPKPFLGGTGYWSIVNRFRLIGGH